MTRYKQICQNREIKCREISPFTNCVCVSYCGACRWIVVVWGCRRTFMCAEAKIILRGNSKHPLFAPIRPSANLRAFLCFPLSKFPDWKGLSYSFPATKVIPSFFCTARQHRPNELALTPTRWFRFCICKCLEHQKPPLYQMYVVNLSSTINPIHHYELAIRAKYWHYLTRDDTLPVSRLLVPYMAKAQGDYCLCSDQ